jgi:DNA-directed RNA polymerase specialized sigma24 family protein
LTTNNSHSDDDDAATDLPAHDKGTKWELTPQAFEKLLACFDPDRDEAGKRYAKTLVKLSRYFEWRGSDDPERDAQETLDRVARKIDEGKIVSNLNAYIYSVAGRILKEIWRRQERERRLSEGLPTTMSPPQLEDDKSERRLHCLDKCLEELPPEGRRLILDYHREAGHAKIELRKQMAQEMGIPPNALRIRAHRIRVELEECIGKCLSQQS